MLIGIVCVAIAGATLFLDDAPSLNPWGSDFKFARTEAAIAAAMAFYMSYALAADRALPVWRAICLLVFALMTSALGLLAFRTLEIGVTRARLIEVGSADADDVRIAIGRRAGFSGWIRPPVALYRSGTSYALFACHAFGPKRLTSPIGPSVAPFGERRKRGLASVSIRIDDPGTGVGLVLRGIPDWEAQEVKLVEQ